MNTLWTKPQESTSNSEHERSVTESQIISNLNTNIEDLLNKISQVTNNYDPLPELPSPSLMRSPSISEQLPTYQKHFPLKKLQSLPQKQYTFATFNQPLTPSYSNNSKENYSLAQDYQGQQWHLPKSINFNGVRYPHTGSPVSLKQINDSPPKMTKIHSLFDNRSVRQIAESKIFTPHNEQHSPVTSKKKISQPLVTSTIIEERQPIPVEEPKLSIRLSDFELGKQLGSGKFGDVYQCKHKKTGTMYALKKVFKSAIKENKMEAQFALQLKILYKLDHPNIVKLYAHFDDQYHVFLLMEYLEGGQLLAKLGSHESYVSPVMTQIIDAVEYLHRQGVVHRDIKPENIVLSFEKTVKLCDFGWAGLLQADRMKTTFCGTLDYVSPQMKDKGQYNQQVDIWSIGVLTFQLLTGHAPFKDQIAQWKRKGGKRGQQWDWHLLYPPSLSSLAESFMRSVLKPNPQQRASLRYLRNHFFLGKYRESYFPTFDFLL